MSTQRRLSKDRSSQFTVLAVTRAVAVVGLVIAIGYSNAALAAAPGKQAVPQPAALKSVDLNLAPISKTVQPAARADEDLLKAKKWCTRMLAILARGGGNFSNGVAPSDVTVFGASSEFTCKDVLDSHPIDIVK